MYESSLYNIWFRLVHEKVLHSALQGRADRISSSHHALRTGSRCLAMSRPSLKLGPSFPGTFSPRIEMPGSTSLQLADSATQTGCEEGARLLTTADSAIRVLLPENNCADFTEPSGQAKSPLCHGHKARGRLLLVDHSVSGAFTVLRTPDSRGSPSDQVDLTEARA